MIVNGNTIRAIVTDLDGTLLDPLGNITEYTSCILKRLYVSGIEIVFITDRHPKEVFEQIKPLDFTPAILGCHGALETRKNEPVYAQNIRFSKSTFEKLIRFLSHPNIQVNVYDIHGCHVSQINHRCSSRSSSFQLPYCVQHPNHLLNLNANKLSISVSHDIKRVELKLRSLFKNECEISLSSNQTLDISPKGVTKKTSAIKHLSLKGINLEKETIAFGDGMDDESILNAAALGIVVQNAVADLPRRLPNPLFTHSNANDGVAKFLLRFFDLSLKGTFA